MKTKSSQGITSFHLLAQLPVLFATLLLAFSPTLALRAQTYRVLHHFSTPDGSTRPYGGLVLSGSTLYGTASAPYPPTAPDWGAVFKINTDGSGFTVLKKFNGLDGAAPWHVLALSGNTLFGVTRLGGAAGYGTLFKVNTDGSGFAVLKDFVSLQAGYEPSGHLVVSGSSLYGMTSRGGASGYGNVFKINTDGSQFATLRSFSGNSPDGADTYGGLSLVDNTLYGTTVQGGISNSFDAYGCGTVFAIKTDGSGFRVIKRFLGGDDGEHPDVNPTVAGTNLYGTTDWLAFGSESNYGTVYRVNADGSGFITLKAFTNSLAEGRGPTDLVLDGDTLFGTARSGGVTGSGVVFRINVDGSDFSVLKHFTGDDGLSPNGGLVIGDTTIYGTTIGGGDASGGVLFALGYPPMLISGPRTQTAESSSSVNLTARIEPRQAAWYQWFFNATNLLATTTNATLWLTNVQPAEAGAYQVMVTNLFGAVTSAPALLSVISAVERRSVPGLIIHGQIGTVLKVDCAHTLAPVPEWTMLGSVSVTTAPQFYFDLTEPLPSVCFYRTTETPTPGASRQVHIISSLDLSFVPAITLTGNLGDTWRLDYINAIGPTDAWVTLDTVTLTNTSQLYFDVTAPDQPARLYRIVPLP